MSAQRRSPETTPDLGAGETQRCEVGTNFPLSLKSGTRFGGQRAELRRRQSMSSRRRRTQRPELCPLDHLRDHRGSRFATDKVLRNHSPAGGGRTANRAYSRHVERTRHRCLEALPSDWRRYGCVSPARPRRGRFDGPARPHRAGARTGKGVGRPSSSLGGNQSDGPTPHSACTSSLQVPVQRSVIIHRPVELRLPPEWA